jgi:peptidyl-prolyl cis-trans isomerase D
MLASLRKHVSSWTAKLILSALIISFVFFWGIGDVLRRGGGIDVAHIGDITITRTDFAHELQASIKKFEAHTNQPITPQMLLESGLPQLVLGEMVSSALIDNEATRLRIVALDHAIRQQIQEMPIFQGSDGHFNRKRLQQTLTDLNMTETKFVNLIRRDLIRQTFVDNVFAKPLSSPDLMPKSITNGLYQWVFSPRKISLISLKNSEMPIATAPSDSELESFYHREGQTQFTQPEKRDITVVWVDPKAKAHTMLVDNAQIKQYYEENQASFAQAERRQVQQVVFKTREQAQDFLDTLKQRPKDLSRIAKNFKAGFTTITATRETLSPVLGNAIFSTPLDRVSAIIEHEGNFYVFKTLAIEAATVPSLAKVESSIRKRLQLELASQKFAEQVRTIEDDLAGGSSLADITKQYGLAMASVKGLVAEGENRQLANLPENLRTEVLNQTMTLNQGDTSPLWQVGTGEYVLVHVDAVTAKHQPDFKEIKEPLLELWRKKQRAAAAEKLANTLMQTAREESMPLSSAAKKHQVFVREDIIKPTHEHEQYPKALLKALFDLKIGEIKSVYHGDGVYVVQVLEILPSVQNSKDWNKLHSELTDAYKNDIIAAYLAQLRQDFKTTINDAAMQSMFTQQG